MSFSLSSFLTHPVSPDPILPGQESVWSYPRPAVAERTDRHLKIVHRGFTLAETRSGFRTLETSHPPSYYFPPEHVATMLLGESHQRTQCEWKGQARYFDVDIDDEVLRDAAWCYPNPDPAFAMLTGCFAFYAGVFDTCTVDGENVVPQGGGFYGGWITGDLAGPFKGVPGSRGW